MPARPSNRLVGDRVANVAACAWIAGLIAWYAGGSSAIDRTLEPMALFIPVAIFSVLGGAAGLITEKKVDKASLGTALFLAAGLALLGFDLVALLNRHVDGSAATVERATVLAFKDPTKGPRTVSLELGGERVSVQATHAEGCGVGSSASVELREGALGAPWLQSISCAP